jgi:hypothetical protein
MREVEVGFRSIETIKFYFRKRSRCSAESKGPRNEEFLAQERLHSSTVGLLDQVGGSGA